MFKASHEKRWKIIRDAQNLITGGVQDSAVIAEMRRANPGMSKRTASRYCACAYQDFDRDAKRRRRGQLSTAIAERGRAKRIALTRQKIIVNGGVVQKESDPDQAGYLAACESEARLLGLNAPERKEIVVATFDVVFSELADAMRAEIVDPLPPARELLLRLARRFKSVLESGARTIAAKDSIIDVSTSSLSLGPPPVPGHFASQSKPNPNHENPGTNGTNGAH